MEGLRIKDFSFGETILTAILVFGFSPAVWAQNEQTNRTEAKTQFPANSEMILAYYGRP